MLYSTVVGWPVAVVVCISVSVAGVLVLYLVTRMRSGNRRRNQLNVPGDDMHSQMEWEDDIGLNIIVNPLEEPKKSVQPTNVPQFTEHIDDEYEGTTSDDDEDEEECDGHSHNEYSSEQDDDDDECDEDYYNHNQIRSKQHQLEWDDEAMEYGPRKV